MVQFITSTVLGGKFETPERYTKPETLKIGISGIVCSSWDQIKQQYVAVKKIRDPFGTPATAESVFREIKLLKHLKHENVIHPLDIFISPAEDVYLVTDLMQTDLRTCLKARSIRHEFVQFIIYQILRGLKYLHSAGVVHRDLQPGNILINQNCDLKICDFGLGRPSDPHSAGHVSSRCYRAPEMILSWEKCDEKIDIWSAGCIFAEMLLGKPLFAGRNDVDQFCAITELLGTPDEDLLARITSQSDLSFILSLPYREGTGVSSILPHFNQTGLDLLERMLTFDSNERISASDALAAPYLATYHDPTDEPVAGDTFDWSFDGRWGSHHTSRMKIYNEVLEYQKQAELQESVRNWSQTTSRAQC